MKNYVQPGNTLTLVAPAGGTTSGAGLLVGAIFGIASSTVDASAEVAVDVVGVFELPKAVGAVTQGAKVYWDNTAKNVTTTVGTNTLIGACTVAAANGDTTIQVRLNGAV